MMDMLLKACMDMNSPETANVSVSAVGILGSLSPGRHYYATARTFTDKVTCLGTRGSLNGNSLATEKPCESTTVCFYKEAVLGIVVASGKVP